MSSIIIVPAEVGQEIEWLNEIFNVKVKGIVLKQYENSVCVTILNYKEKHREMYKSERTIVKHQRYKVLNR